jgi:DNA invertase Pin-like site-specific DNA recombinase
MKTTTQSTPTLGYASVASGEPLDGPGIEGQLEAIDSACARLNLRLVDVARDHQAEGADDADRPALVRLLDRIDSGEASCLIVSDLERLTRITGQLETILDRLEKRGARLVALNVGLDSATEAGSRAIGRGARAPKPGAVEPEPKPEPPTPLRELGPEPAPAAVRAFGYATAPADSVQGTKDLAEQRLAIERYCAKHGIEVVKVVREREPKDGKALDRAGLSLLIERIAAGDGSCLVVTELQRLSRSATELGTILQWVERNQVRLIAVELDLDTASPGGNTTTRALASVARMEHERLSRRTRKGLAATRATRHSAGPADSEAIRKRIVDMRADGMTLQAIADTLNEEGVPTQRGGAKWRPSSVQTAAGYRRPRRSSNVSDLPAAASGRGRR